ncbi:hypothetical protein jhhlp_008342 [Lomentospora prolificans]|uniref:NmrA-like domain-containing protein n=1 Tax=Lomentospora prolificans TaxID=41688 RepID=A0A2N3MXS5_9PEZI|nr:hypothetical protein jhhlp_008342 [Lomentospora prolificans]
MAEGILVLGAGELGLAVIEALVKHAKRNNTKISVLMRQSTLDSAAPEKIRATEHFKKQGVHLDAGDVTQASVSELAAIFAKYDTVVSCTGMGLPSGTQGKITDAVLEGKVRRYFPWQFGMDYDVIGEGSSQDLFDEQLLVRKKLRAQSQTEWVIVSTGLFMSFLFEPAFGVVDIENKTVRALGSWDNSITLTTATDIGRVTADVILDPRDVKNQVVYTAGDTVTYEKLAESLDDCFKTPFKRELWDLPILRKQMEEDPNTMVKYRDTFAQGRGVSWPLSQTVNAARGIQLTDIQSYLKELVVKLG